MLEIGRGELLESFAGGGGKGEVNEPVGFTVLPRAAVDEAGQLGHRGHAEGHRRRALQAMLPDQGLGLAGQVDAQRVRPGGVEFPGDGRAEVAGAAAGDDGNEIFHATVHGAAAEAKGRVARAPVRCRITSRGGRHRPGGWRR
jgi:hypothetical protein